MAVQNHGMPMSYGDWARDRVLGKGAFGTVCLWINSITRKEIAIKKVINLSSMSRWKTEVQMMRDMQHPNIVSFIIIPQALSVEYPSQVSVGMEYCSCGDLRRFMVKAEFCCGLPEYHVRDVLLDIGSAISYLHAKHNMHRDLKPENIVLKPKPGCPGRYQFKVTDLGYAKDLDSASISGAESFVGTMLYLAPEQVFGRDHQNSSKTKRYYPVVDYWSFGFVMFECITARRPFFHNDSLAPGRPLMLVNNKKYEDICGWMLPNSDKYCFGEHLPQPHSLSPNFAKDMTLWLRLMLCVDGGKRGGENGDEWYSMITEIITPKKYVQVLNMTNMEILYIQIDESSSLHAVNKKILEMTKILMNHQLLLFANGNPPNGTVAIFNQLREANPETPHDALIFLFDKSWAEPRSYEAKEPDEINHFKNNRNMERSDKIERHIFKIAVNDTFNGVKIGIRFQNASMALLDTLVRSFTRLKENLHELIKKTYKIEGMTDFFIKTVNNDIFENDQQQQDNPAEISDNDQYTTECRQILEESKDWKTSIVKAQNLIKEIETEIGNPFYFSLSNYRQEFVKTAASLRETKIDAVQRYDHFRRELKRMENLQSKQELRRFRKEQIQSYLEACWKINRCKIHDMLNCQKRNVNLLRSFVTRHCALQEAFFQIDKTSTELSCISSNIEQRQRKHQHDLWNLLQHMKNLYNVANDYEGNNYNTVPLFINECDRLQKTVEDMTNDQDILDVLNSAVEHSTDQHQTPPATVPVP